MPRRPDISKFCSSGLLSIVLLALISVVASARNVKNWNCATEPVQPNLVVASDTHVIGHLQDQTSAPFGRSKVLLRRYQTSSESVDMKTVTTDGNGNFDLGALSAGKYRLLASPTRAFAQPEKLKCQGREGCKLEITLKANPTDLPYAMCPVK